MVLAILMAGKIQRYIPVQQGTIEVCGLDVMGVSGKAVAQTDAVQRGYIADLNGLPAGVVGRLQVVRRAAPEREILRELNRMAISAEEPGVTIDTQL